MQPCPLRDEAARLANLRIPLRPQVADLGRRDDRPVHGADRRHDREHLDPQLQQDLDAPVDTVSWVLNAYNIVFAVLLVSMGRLADQFGRRRFFLIGMAIFTVGSLLCAISSVDRRADRVPRDPGRRRRDPRADRAGDDRAGVPARQRGLGLALMAVVANRPPRSGRPSAACWWSSGWPFDAAGTGSSSSTSRSGSLGMALAVRVVPETCDPTSGTGGRLVRDGNRWVAAIFCLTYGLVEANTRGWGRRGSSPCSPAPSLLRRRVRALAALGDSRCWRPRCSATGSSWAPARLCCCSDRADGPAVPGRARVREHVGLLGAQGGAGGRPVAVMAMVVSPLVGRQSATCHLG